MACLIYINHNSILLWMIDQSIILFLNACLYSLLKGNYIKILEPTKQMPLCLHTNSTTHFLRLETDYSES